jgi:heme/copper-type cytochrome/quinol oxidase subunit 2
MMPSFTVLYAMESKGILREFEVKITGKQWYWNYEVSTAPLENIDYPKVDSIANNFYEKINEGTETIIVSELQDAKKTSKQEYEALELITNRIITGFL